MFPICTALYYQGKVAGGPGSEEVRRHVQDEEQVNKAIHDPTQVPLCRLEVERQAHCGKADRGKSARVFIFEHSDAGVFKRVQKRETRSGWDGGLDYSRGITMQQYRTGTMENRSHDLRIKACAPREAHAWCI